MPETLDDDVQLGERQDGILQKIKTKKKSRGLSQSSGELEAEAQPANAGSYQARGDVTGFCWPALCYGSCVLASGRRWPDHKAENR
jgi:hypothetical protein